MRFRSNDIKNEIKGSGFFKNYPQSKTITAKFMELLILIYLSLFVFDIQI